MWSKVKHLFKFLSQKLIEINDSPHKIAMGVGIGVFCGIFPGIGPMAALGLAFLFRVNRAGALLGSLLTNTWISFLGFVFSIKIGSAVTQTNWQEIYGQAKSLIDHFRWELLWDTAVLKILGTLLIGYFIFGLAAGLLVYALAFLLLKKNKRSLVNQ